MELKDRKFIKNNKTLPEFADGVPPYLDKDAGNVGWALKTNNSTWGTQNNNQPGWSNYWEKGAWTSMPYSSYQKMAGWLNPMTGYGALEFKNDPLMKPKESEITPLTKPLSTSNGETGGGGGDKGVVKTKGPTDYTAAVTGVADTGAKIYSSFYNPITPLQLLYQAGELELLAGDVKFTAPNNIDANAELERVKKANTTSILGTTATGLGAGAAVGSMVMPGVGTAIGAGIGALVGLIGSGIGSIFSRNKSKRAIEEAQRQATMKQISAKDSAFTEYLQQKRLIAQGTGEDQPIELYIRYKDGKPAYKYGKPVYAAFGRTGNKQNSWGSAGETIVDTKSGKYSVLPGIPNFRDTLPMFVRGKDAVLSNHGASLYFQATRDLDGALAMDLMYRDSSTNSFRNGKLPGFYEGWLGNAIPHFAGMTASLGQLFDAYNDKIKVTDVTTPNRYAKSALNNLAGLRINPIPIANNIYSAQAVTDNAINSTYGLSGAQRAKFRSLNMFNTQRALSKLGIEAQERNNSYIALLANAKAQIGAQDAQLASRNKQFNEEMTAKAHGAQRQMQQMGIRNFIDQLLSWGANDFKRRQFNDTMDLYRQNLLLDRERLYRDMANNNSNGVKVSPLYNNLAMYGGNPLWWS